MQSEGKGRLTVPMAEGPDQAALSCALVDVESYRIAPSAHAHPFGSFTTTNPDPALAEKRKPAFAMVSIAKPLAFLSISEGMILLKPANI